ncbi:hypothetical protein K438DRAFT_1808840 [Mycena galopus ATCC 62051]|nr:hypothetical protein K438DRAFT_1808840 [Mycena galopus ATCC 62051]
MDRYSKRIQAIACLVSVTLLATFLWLRRTSTTTTVVPLRFSSAGANVDIMAPTIKALNNMGYSVLYAHTMDAAVQLHHLYENLIAMVIANADQIKWCFQQESCGRSAVNPAGIPVWKFFSFHFWADSGHPLGSKWTLSPEDYKTNNYLGYSIEAQCYKQPFVPHSERKRQVYILAKVLKFFEPNARAWAPDFFDAAANATGESPEAPPLQPGTCVYYAVLNHFRSPTPYDALCLGVPFVNPIISRSADFRNCVVEQENPTDRTKWQTQHDELKGHSAPYVYHVFIGDRDGFVDAIKRAVENPIESYVLERMKITSVEYRLGKMLEHDWRTEAEELLKARKAGLASGEVNAFK